MDVHTDTAEDPLSQAVVRLDGAMNRVEAVTARLVNRALSAERDAIQAGDADADRARLAEELDAARGREAVLQTAAQEASEALDQAIEDLRAVVTEE